MEAARKLTGCILNVEFLLLICQPLRRPSSYDCSVYVSIIRTLPPPPPLPPPQPAACACRSQRRRTGDHVEKSQEPASHDGAAHFAVIAERLGSGTAATVGKRRRWRRWRRPERVGQHIEKPFVRSQFSVLLLSLSVNHELPLNPTSPT